MSSGDPIEFTRDVSTGQQRAGNRVQLEDGDAEAITNVNPLPVELTNPTSGQPLLVDEITGAQVTIDVVHHEIHEGEAFGAGYISPHGSLVADDGTIDLVLFTTTKYCHLTAQGSFGGNFEGYLYEEPTVTGGSGTAVTVQNHKRTGGDASTVTVRHSMTVTNVGTLLEGAFVPGGTGGRAIGATQAQRFEWILKLNTTYLIRLINRAGTAQQGGIGASWYEESDN